MKMVAMCSQACWRFFGAKLIMNQDKKNFVDTERIRLELEEYKRFAFSKNFLALALSMVMAQAAHNLVSSMSESLIMPVINYVVNSAQGDWRLLVFDPIPGLKIEIGRIFSGALEFLFTSAFVYLFYIKIMRKDKQDISH